jgi:hypothetical protein
MLLCLEPEHRGDANTAGRSAGENSKARCQKEVLDNSSQASGY